MDICCNSIHCYRNAKRKCEKCEYVPYCSSVCQERDIIGHDEICHIDPCVRILKYADILTKYNVSCPNVSMMRRVTINDTDYILGAFHNNVTCVICHDIITHCAVEDELNNGVKYDTCMDCHNKYWKLCPISGRNTIICSQESDALIKKLLMLSLVDDLPMDIIGYLARIAGSFLPCTLKHICGDDSAYAAPCGK